MKAVQTVFSDFYVSIYIEYIETIFNDFINKIMVSHTIHYYLSSSKDKLHYIFINKQYLFFLISYSCF